MKLPKATHELKTLFIYYAGIYNGKKTFELRKNDRDFKVGDILLLKEINSKGIYTNRQCYRIITYVLKDCPEFGLEKGFTILGIKQIKNKQNETTI